MEIINFKRKKNKLLINEQQKSYENVKFFYICREKFENKYAEVKKCCNVGEHCRYSAEYRVAAHSICNLKYSIPNEIPIVFHNRSNYDYYFIIKELELS